MSSAGFDGFHPSKTWVSRSYNYGEDDPSLSSNIKSIVGKDTELEITEIKRNETPKIVRRKFYDVPSVREFFLGDVYDRQSLRTISVNKLSGELVMLLGARFDMDYETWTCRLFPSDREYFASPLSERGPKHFSNFHLACVEFFRATRDTPDEFLQNRRINRTVRLMKFLGLRDSSESEKPKVYVIRRVSGHLRLDGQLWTFLFFCEPFQSFEFSGYSQNALENPMAPLTRWVTDAINLDTPNEHLQRLEIDGYGLVVKILRDIKSSWKLLLGEMEDFLEELNESFDEDEFIEAAPYLHREFILYIDFFQRQLFYHQRYTSYLITHAEDPRCIYPTQFRPDVSQENDALKVLHDRLQAVRDRTTTILDLASVFKAFPVPKMPCFALPANDHSKILNLTTIKQARLSSQILLLQREDARSTYRQGEILKQLTILNMLYLPPSFIAAVYGMNTRTTQQTQIWTFVLVALFFTCITMLLVYATFRWEARWEAQHTPKSIEGKGNDTYQAKAQPAGALETRKPPHT